MKKLILLAGTTLAVTACTNNNASENWTNYDSAFLSASQLSDNQSLAVFYRTADFQGPAVNVYVNGDYQVSLLEKGYSPIALCANNQLVTASYTHEGFGNRTQGNHFDLPAKEIAYFRATAKGNKVSFEQVDVATASDELNALEGKVTHALSRVRNNCN